mmetsp:Transcript_3536/g.7812  ORF Transcript_3536/g.7812 Transcript_3536/m.7812 type:complete len:111 (+) Transcript_3536:99-431(+)
MPQKSSTVFGQPMILSQNLTQFTFGGQESSGGRDTERYQDALQPLGEGEAIHLTSEIFSHNQGWAECAFETAEHLLQEVLGVAGQSWLEKRITANLCHFLLTVVPTKNNE